MKRIQELLDLITSETNEEKVLLLLDELYLLTKDGI